MTEAELKQLAIDQVDGKVLFASQISADMVPSVFMALRFCDDAQVAELSESADIYEYLSAATETTINGHPVFVSFRKITKPDRDRLILFASQYLEQKNTFLGTEEGLSILVKPQ